MHTPSHTPSVHVSVKDGAALFGMAAGQFNQLVDNAQGDAKEHITDVSFAGRFIVTCSADGDDVFVCVFDAVRM